MRMLTYFLLFCIVILGIIFALLNATPVELNYLFGHKQFPLSLLLAYVLFLGALLSMLFCLLPYLRLKLENCRLKKRLHKLTQDS
jgi:putative membrane protein